MERPNTVSGLEAKRAELIAYRGRLECELRKLTCDLDHLEAAIALFDPQQTPKTVLRYVAKHRAKKGHLKRFVLEMLRDSKTPLTSKDITTDWIAKRGLRADDATYVILRKRIGACLITLRNQGVATDVGTVCEYKVWALTA